MIKEAVLVDSDIFIDLFRGLPKAKEFFISAREKYDVHFSAITEAELFSGKQLDSTEEQNIVDDVLNLFKRVDFGREIARKTGEIIRKPNILFADAGIVATAMSINAKKLITRNRKHFEKILKVETPY